MKKNFILFALMLFLPLLAFAQRMEVTLSSPSATYNGQNQMPTITARYYRENSQRPAYTSSMIGTNEQQGNITIAVTYKGESVTTAVDAGEYTITASRRSGQGTQAQVYESTATFIISPKDIKTVSFSVTPQVFAYTGNECKPTEDVVDSQLGVQLVKDQDYTIAYENNVNGLDGNGMATATITGKDNYFSSKTVAFTILSAIPVGEVPEDDFSQAIISLSDVEYNGTATAASFASVTLLKQIEQNPVNVPQIYGTDYKVVGYVFTDDYNGGDYNLSSIQAAPDHVGKWYVLIADADGTNDPSKWGAAPFNVTARDLKIDLLEIHKTYGDKDPVLTMDNISTWASVNWAPGDGPSNTTIDNILFDRKDVGENAYDADGNQLPYKYSLKNPTKLEAYKEVGGVKYYNYNVGVGQSSSLLIDKKVKLVVTCDTKTGQANVNVPDDWKIYNNNDPVNENGSFDFKIVSGLINNDVVQDTDPSKVILSVTRIPGEDVGSYAFIANAPNYIVEFQDQFTIRKSTDLSGITPVFKNNGKFEYKGAAYNNVDDLGFKLQFKGANLLPGTDYTVQYGTNTNVRTNNNSGNYVRVTFIKNFDGRKDYTFEITKKNLDITADPHEMNAGDADPVFTLTYTGLVGQDLNNGQPVFDTNNNSLKRLKAPTVTKKATSYDGIYDLIVNDDYIADNYNVSLHNGVLTFGKGIITIVADNKGIEWPNWIYYGTDPATVTLTATESGATKADLDRVLRPAGKPIYTITRVIPENTQDGKDAGDYVIKAVGPTATTDYGILYVDGTFRITPATLTITSQNGEKVYGEADPDLETLIKFSGTQYGEDAKEVLKKSVTNWVQSTTFPFGWSEVTTIEPVYNVTRAEGEDVKYKGNNYDYDGYTIYVSGDASVKNYNITYKSTGLLTIKRRPMNITADDLEKYYGQVDPELTYEIEAVTHKPEAEERGLMEWPTIDRYEFNWETFTWDPVYQYVPDALAENTFVISRERIDNERYGENVREGGYKIQFTPNSGDLKWNNNRSWFTRLNPNYDITYVSAVLTIKKAVLNVTAYDQGVQYGKSINKNVFVQPESGEKIYAFGVQIAVDDDEEPMGAMQNQDVIVWVKRDTRGNIIETKSLNDLPEDILYLKTEKTKVGGYTPEDEPYIPVLTELGETNYVINVFKQAYLTITRLDIIPLNDDALAEMYPLIAEKYNESEKTYSLLAQVLDDHQGATVTVKLNRDRQFRKDQWYSLVLPFDIRVRDLSKALGYAVVDMMTETNEKANNLSLALYNDIIPANKPFIVQVDETIPVGNRPVGVTEAQVENFMGDVQFKDVKIAAFNYMTEDPTAEDGAGNKFIGTYNGLDNLSTKQYALYEGPDELPADFTGKDPRGNFYHGYADPTKEWPLAQTEAYWVPFNANASVRITIQEPDGSTTAIDGVAADDIEIAGEGAVADGWYTINGIKLNAQPTESGTYIFNGKKVFFQAK